MRKTNLSELINKSSKTSTSDVIAVCVTTIAVAGVFVPFFTPMLTPNGMTPEFMGILIALAALLFGDRIIDFFRSREHKEAILDLVKAIETPISEAIECRHIGTYCEALEYVKSRLPYAYAVKDVTIVHGISQKDIELYFYKKEDANRLATVIAEFVDRGYVWRSIISENIKDIIIPQALAGIKEEKKKQFHVQVMKQYHPTINFTIIEYGMHGDDRQVLFGWGHHKFDEQGHVFSSTNSFLVDTFEKIYHSMAEVIENKEAKDAEALGEKVVPISIPKQTAAE